MMIFSGTGWLAILVLGGIAGALGKLLMPGKDPGGIFVTILLGMAGALLMTFLGHAMGWYAPYEGANLIGAVIGSVLLLILYRVIAQNRSRG